MADLLSTSIAGTLNVSQGASVAGNLFVSGLNILDEIQIADNLTRVSANSGSIQSAVALNFVNTSTTTVNVSAGSPGNANIAITSIGLQTQNSVSVFSNKNVGEWVHTKDGKFFNIGTTPTGVFANTSGTRFYVTDDTGDIIYQLNLSEAWNISSASVESANLSINAVETQPQDIFLKDDGTILYVLGDGGNDITWFDLSEAWNVRTATANSQTSPTLNLQTTSPRGLFIKEDGTKFWVCSTTTVFQFTMSNPWDMATATYDSISLVTTVETALTGLSIDPTGNYLYLIGTTRDDILEYKMSTPFNVSTASYTGLFYSIRDRQTTYSTEGTPAGIFVAYPNNRMYIAGSGADQIIQYEMDQGITLDAKKVFANGKGLFADDIFVIGDVIATEALVSEGSLSVGTSGQFTISTAGAISSSLTISGSPLTVTGSTQDIGTGTGNTTTNVAIGATIADSTKNVRIGTGGVAGSITNITIGTNSGGDANVIINANTVTISNTVSIGNQLVVSGLNILNEIGIADNLARVSANSGSIQSAVALNFINTATVQVSVTPGETGFANIALTSSGSSGVTSVDTGLGLTGGPITSTGTISANIASTTVQGITKLIDSVTSTDAANAATANSVKLAYDLATIGANTTSVSANSGSLINDASLNFNNTATIQVSVTAGVSGNANVSFNSHIANGSITSAATISPLRTGPHNHYAVTALATAATIEPPEVNTGKDGDRLTLRIQDNGTGRGLTWNTAAGAYRAIGVTLPTTTVATKVLYIGSIYNSTDNFWDVVAYVVQA